MIQQLTLLLATPIVKAILDKFYEGIGSKLGEKAADALPEKVKQLGQLVWDRCLRGKPDTEAMLEKAANGSQPDQQRLAELLHHELETNAILRQEFQPLATEIHQSIQFDEVNAKNVQQIFGGQGLMVTEKQEQPIIQIQGNPTINFGKPNAD